MGKLVLCVGGFVAWFVGMGVVGCGKLDLGVSAAKTDRLRLREFESLGFCFFFLISLIRTILGGIARAGFSHRRVLSRTPL